MNKVLIITYYWPPSGGAGVQRWLKFAKYLPEFGWEPIIITVDPDYATYPVIDNSLKDDISVDLRVYSTRAIDYFSIYKKDKSRIPTAGFANSVENTLKGKILRFIRGNFFIPDPRKGWNKYSFNKACELIEREDIKHVITTSPPHSTQLIGLKIKKKYPEIKWIADLRDPWTDIYYYKQFYPTLISKEIDLFFERSVLQKADRIIAVGPSLKNSYALKAKGTENKIEVITNGFDEEDFIPYPELSLPIFTISYIGTLSDAYPIEGFLNAINNFIENGNDTQLRFIGTVSPKQKNAILSSPGCQSAEFVDNVDHNAAIRYMLESSLLLLIIPDHQSNKSIITGKLFEYLGSGNPVICLGPKDGDAAEILRETGKGSTFSYDDSKGILDYLMTRYSGNFNIEKGSTNVFSRRELTRKIISLLEEK